MRKAEQRWPAESKADEITSPTTCSASALESTIMALRPPVSAMNGTGWPLRVRRPASWRGDQARYRGRAREHDALRARVGHQRGADFARAGNELQRVLGHAGGVQQAHGFGRDQRGLLGGLGDDGVAGGERGGDLAGEDGERKVPGADADDDAERRRRAGAEQALRAVGVIAQEIHRLAQLGDGVGVGLAGFAHGQTDQARRGGLERVGGAAQGGGALGDGALAPGRRGGGGCWRARPRSRGGPA